MAKNDDKYTDPGTELRNQIKEDIQADSKGGQPGQWSARKAQMMASEYKKQMHERGEEPYTTDKSEQSEGQKHLNDWTKEEWQTSEGKGNAKQPDGTEQRYLPKKAWESMAEEEKEATNKAKLEGSARGEQYVPNTSEAQKARKDAKDNGATAIEDADGDAYEQTDGEHETEENASPKRGSKHKRDEKSDEDEGDADGETAVNEKEEEETVQSQPPAKQAKGDDGEKRATQSKSKGESESAKSDKEAAGKKGDEEHGEPASATRLPKEGQHVFWRATPGWVEGTVVEICHSEKEVDGKHVKASQDDPRIVLKSAKSGKTAVHKPEAVYF
ncbi:hypothetical protein ACEPAH_1516 [Sanghuangporus vaninii]